MTRRSSTPSCVFDELARHKIFDIIGDFIYSVDWRAAITAHMTGHSDNIALLRKPRGPEFVMAMACVMNA
jgi:UDP-3-O-acyl-N-acetylglucosamine deacetylase